MTWMLQAAAVLAVPLSLVGAVKAGTYVYRRAREDRTGAALTGIDLQLSSVPGMREFVGWVGERVDGFKDWVADKVDAAFDSDGTSGGGGGFDSDGGADASGGGND
jgi:hypothetical protein